MRSSSRGTHQQIFGSEALEFEGEVVPSRECGLGEGVDGFIVHLLMKLGAANRTERTAIAIRKHLLERGGRVTA